MVPVWFVSIKSQLKHMFLTLSLSQKSSENTGFE